MRYAFIILIFTALAISACQSDRVAVSREPDGPPARSQLVPTFTPLPPATATITPLPTAAPTESYITPTPDQFQAAGLPVRIEIPAIKVDAVVEHVGRLPSGQMDVPHVPADVAWFNESALPGQDLTKTSVINGHLDSPYGPAVFFALRKLVAGDELVVTYSNGDRYVFVVTEKERYPYDQAPLQKLYGDGETTGRRLNLITCDGAWDRGQANYQQRLVVYTRLVGEGRAPATPIATPAVQGG
jgi:sortase (surface protein transpeptidase)